LLPQISSFLTQNGLREKHFFANNDRFDLQRVLKCKSFEEFDEHFISKQLDYTTIDEYRAACDIDTKVDKIQVPTLFLNSADDMFCPKKGTVFHYPLT
jgi:predicted alpha/beta-fold hydrolase